MLCSFTFALSAVCVQCLIRFFFWQFLNFVLSWFVAQVLFLSDFEIVPVAPVITGITFAFAFQMR